MKTYTGRLINPFNLRPEDIDIMDIAHALSNICRFNGHCRVFYSVAQHSLLVSEQLWNVSIVTRMAGLLHDASEAYLCDIPRPIKYTPEFDAYRRIEKTVQGVIYATFGLEEADFKAVKKTDDEVLAAEGIQLMNEVYTFAKPAFDLNYSRIEPMLPSTARERFMDRFRMYLNYQARKVIA